MFAIVSLLFGVYPRVGGGNPQVADATAVAYGLSPRGRGKLESLGAISVQLRSIPAWAGETNTRIPITPSGNGLSPRGRGKQ